MTVASLIGRVVGNHLRRAADEPNPDGTARYLLSCLDADHVAAIAQNILGDVSLSGKVEMQLPAAFLAGYSLPPSILTKKPATYHRTAPCAKPVLLIASTGDNEEQSLRECTPLGTTELQELPALWVKAASEGLAISTEHTKWWEKALAGLFELRMFSLDALGAYVLRTRSNLESEGMPIVQALGAALPALRVPKDTFYFNGIREASRGHVSAWKSHFGAAFKKRACYLLKRTAAQLVLTEDDLRAAFERVHDSIPEAHHPLVNRFIVSDGSWNDVAALVSEIEWEEVKPLFDGLGREKYNLGVETNAFYDERDPGLLDEFEREYLKLLIARKTTEAREEDTDFYEAHRSELKEDRKLKGAWERFVFGKPREAEDFVSGLGSCLEALFTENVASTKRRLRIRCDRANPTELKELNVDAGLYFARRYGGLRGLFGENVTWSVGKLFDFERQVETWKKAKKKKKKSELNHSTARTALQLKFTLELEVDLATGGTAVSSAQLIWRFSPNTVVSQSYDDWTRLKDHPLIVCKANRVSLSAKGRFQTVDLSNVNTFVPVYDRDRGSFVPSYKKEHDLANTWRQNLKEAQRQGTIGQTVAEELSTTFEKFGAKYAAAIEAFVGGGSLSAAVYQEQATAYAEILDLLCRKAKGDRNRDLLLRPLLEVGAVQIKGGPQAVVVVPWHPLRMFAMSQKAQHLARLVRHLMTAETIRFGEAHLFFKDLVNDLAHVFYPEVVLGWHDNKPLLLVGTDVVQDYSLHEAPVASEAELDDTNENPTDGSNRVLELIQRYLALHPHEHANMSVVLFNCDSARLPQAVVDKIGTLYEDEEDVRCQVLLRHVDTGRLRDLYRDIVGLSDRDGDAFNASEATQDFMARLRICIIADQAPPPDPKDGCPYDIVFSQDVIARHAQLEWYKETARPIPADQLVPSQWSRRKPAAKDDMRSVVYLCCPAQSAEGWAYLTAITSFLKNDWDGDEERRLLPARQLDFRDPRTARIFDETHNLGNWVVNYDELLDRRQLINQNVQIIRYKQSTTQGRNVIISSKTHLGLLKSMILRRLKDLGLGLSDGDCVQLAQKFIDDANDISGDIVLRAARRGRNASELIGVVLSRYLVRRELGEGRYFGTYFLDDYAEWLGHREEQIADILLLSPEKLPDGTLRLAMIAAEAKYGDASNVAAKRKESQKQLRDTIQRMEEAIFGDPERLDRSLWLARLSDLLLDGIQIPASSQINLADWRRSVREGKCEIYLRGYSHVFVAEAIEGQDASDFVAVAGLEDCYQEVFDRKRVKELVLKYFKDEDPMAVRASVGDENVWGKRRYRRPSDHRIVYSKSEPKDPDDGTPPVARLVTTVSSPKLPPTPIVASGEPPHEPSGSSGWAYPIETLLSGHDVGQETDAEREWLKSTEFKLKNALQQFHLQSKLVSSKLTPNAALLKFAGSATLTIEQVAKRRSELLTTHGLHVIGIQPEPNVVSLSIERPSRKVVRIQDLWARWKPNVIHGNQDLLIGLREDDGELFFLSPGKAHAPHTLIAGSTGSGKSVLMQNIILGIAATNRPEQARIVLIDPKQGVDYFQFDGLPHLQGGVIDDQDVAIGRLEQLVVEMDARYAKFKAARVPNLATFNQRAAPAERLPTLWLIHDEFAEWMMVEEYKEQVATVVGRLGVKARAAGIHLVFAAQRPDANVMPMQLRANLGNRLILRVDSEGTSEIALGERGAERLLGKGHLLAKLEGVGALNYAQVPFVDVDFMESVTSIIQGAKKTAVATPSPVASAAVPPLVDELYALCAQGRDQEAVERVLSRFESDLRARRFAAVDEVLSQADVARLAASVLIAALTITVPAKDLLRARAAFLRQVEETLRASLGPERADALLVARR